MLPFRIRAAGDAALVLELPAVVDEATSARLIAIADAVRSRYGAILRDAVVGYHTLTVYFDPLAVDGAWMAGELEALAASDTASAPPSGGSVDIPVCYGGEFGPDLPDVAAAAGCSPDDVVELHTSRPYRVFVIGFVPGFAYMGPVDERLALPRRSSPRTRVPPGSVAIAAGQTGIYPMETPGGWHILGRTPLRPFDETRAQPVLFRVGDRVRFHAISAAEYARTATW
ncbi:MAG TPA: 5-oxoprolinase subunit PxpB [Vicinamibacterales bacterium]|nr:5-oxoprolinase subunit PxpB [Vicinamibacterales bacterium]